MSPFRHTLFCSDKGLKRHADSYRAGRELAQRACHQNRETTALAFTYVVAAYVILPRTVRVGLKILQRKHVPRYTVTGDGLPGNLVNPVPTGTPEQLHAAFAIAGWSTANRLGPQHRQIQDLKSYQTGQHLPAEHINHYITAGEELSLQA